MKTKLLTLVALGLCVAAGLSVADVATSRSAPADTPTVTAIRNNIMGMLQRNPKVPIKVLPDIPGPGGAPRATNRDAAYYAWQEFIALNWPNVPVSGNAPSIGFASREFADTTRRFGQPPRAGSNSYPALVWESTRHRAEIYTGTTDQPHGYTNKASLSWGYNSTPGYVYPGLTISPARTQSNSKAIKPGLTPFVNLDEASQIGLCKMYSAGEGVLFMAKANYREYGYIASRGWYNSSVLKPPTSTPTPFPGSPTNPLANFANTSGYIVTQQAFPSPEPLDGSTTTGTGPGNYVSFPNGTMEFKAAFRVATAAERQAYENGQPIPGGYHTAPIRYYTEVSKGVFEYVDTVGVLLSIHIIHKTPTAPYFIFATFEHENNVIGMDGARVEDADGKLNGNAFTTATPAPAPTPPYVYPSSGPSPSPGQYFVAATSPNVFEVPSQVITPAPSVTPIVTVQNFIPGPNENAGKISATQSYYQNARDGDASQQPAANSPSEPDSYFTVNRRRFSIPQPIIAVNQDIHSLIRMYGYKPAGGVSDISPQDNVWLHYKLVNVQWVPAGSNPFQKTPGKIYGDTSSGAKPFIAVESYYLSNSLVETNMVLSAFSGQFADYVPNVADGFSITDFYFAPTTYSNYNMNDASGGNPKQAKKETGDPFYNIYTKGVAYNMGGCMGCHGNTSVNGGSDASFILAHGKPFVIEGIDPPPETMRARFRGYFPKK